MSGQGAAGRPAPKQRRRPAAGVHFTTEEPVLFVDGRRRTSLAKVGRKQDACYLVEEWQDGTLILTPATTLPLSEVEQLRGATGAGSGEDDTMPSPRPSTA